MTIFAEALERTDPAERAAYLDGACEDDAALRRRVEALLAAHDGAGRFLEADSTGMHESTSAETLEATAAVDAATRPPSGAGDRGTSIGRRDSTFAVAPRPTARRIRRGPGHRRPVHAARSPRRGGHGHRLPGQADRNRSSGRSRSS